MLKAVIAFLLLSLSPYHLCAQVLEVINEDPYTPTALIEDVFLGEGIEIISINYGGDARSTAFFRNGSNTIGLDRGIVMTTGVTVDDGSSGGVAEAGRENLSVNNNSLISDDPDLRRVIGNTVTTIHDVTSYEIQFRPLGDSVKFRYVFASEEYPEYVCSRFNDLFGFFLSGPGINGPFSNNAVNLAKIPGTDLPVRINTVNPGVEGSRGTIGGCTPPEGSLSNSDIYIDNFQSDNQPVFDGYTRVLRAEAAVQSCEVYTMRIVIADIGDGSLDSGVFLDAKSFGTSTAGLEIVNLSVNGALAEGCNQAALHFYTNERVSQDLPLTVDFFGDATPGVDYTEPLAEYVIPAGDSLLVVPIAAFEDNVDDNGETIFISFLRSNCYLDTFKIRINENRMENLTVDDRFTLCGSEVVNLSSTLTAAQPTIQRFSNNESLDFSYDIFNPWVSSYIDVDDIFPEIINEESFQSICIDNLEHSRPAQVDVFLFTPSGTILELTTDNGGNGGGAPFEGYLNTCFTADAIERITGPGERAPASYVPFTGNWQPESSLSELWTGVHEPANGRWELRIRDDALFTNGTLNEWSISFREPYNVTYSWDQDADLSCYDCPNPELTATREGYFGLTVTDTDGCSIRDSVQILFNTTSDFSAAPSCVAVTDTSILFNWGSVPGALGYEVRMGRGERFSVGLDTFLNVDTLQDGTTYDFHIRALFEDCIGPELTLSCTTISCEDVFLSLSGMSIDALCIDSASGMITLTAVGDFGPFTYTVGDETRTDGMFEDLTVGTYVAIVNDIYDCQDSSIFVIDAPISLAITTTVSGAVSCGSTAQIAVTATGGVGDYEYYWDGVLGDTVLSGINSAGDYVLEVVDGNGCARYDTITITEPDALFLEHSTSPASCSNVANGTLAVVVSGGTPPYTYEWEDDSDNTSERTGLLPGIYNVTVTDDATCTLVESIVVDQGPDVGIIANVGDVSCFAGNDGTIEILLTDAIAPISYNWEDSALSGNDLQNLVVGDYRLTVTDQRGCQTSTVVEVSQPGPIVIDQLINPPSCIGAQDGAITVSISGGTSPYTYAWGNGTTTAENINLVPGNYTLTVTDVNNCTATRSFIVPQAEEWTIEANVTDNLCVNDMMGRIEVTSTTTLPVTYYWPDLGTTGSEQSNLASGTYEVVATNSNNCTVSTTVELNTPTGVTIETVVEDVRCFGDRNGLVELSGEGGTPPYEYQLSNGRWTSSNAFLDLAAGGYIGAIRDANGCIVYTDELQVGTPNPLVVDLGPTRTIDYGDSLRLIVLSTGGNQPLLTYNWMPTDTVLFSCFDCPAPWVRPFDTRTSIFLEATDQSGCVANGQLTILVDKKFGIYVPSAFSPNGDGINDQFIVYGLPNIEIEQLQIFDRWGGMVFENTNFPVNDPRAGWNGEYNGELMNTAVFVWQLTARRPDGSRVQLSGDCTLVR